MIQLHSNPTDKAMRKLRDAEEARETALQAGRDLTPAEAAKYRHHEVKSAIVAETSGKCAFCESKITHVYWGDVEHIIPKAHVPERTFDYDNLTLACARCNNFKGDYYSPTAPVVHPYEMDPSDHVFGLGMLVWSRPGSDAGPRTIRLLNLNREGLVERRTEVLESIDRKANLYANEPNGPVKDLYLQDLQDSITDSSPYALIARAYLQNALGSDWEG